MAQTLDEDEVLQCECVRQSKNGVYIKRLHVWMYAFAKCSSKNRILALVIIHAQAGQLGNCVSTHLRLHTTLMMTVGCRDMISDQVQERSTFHVCLIRLRSGSCAHGCVYLRSVWLCTCYELTLFRLRLPRPVASSLCTLADTFSVFPSCSPVAFLTSTPTSHLSCLCEEWRPVTQWHTRASAGKTI